MRSVWCMVIAVCLCTAGGHVRSSQHASASELYAPAAPGTVAARRVAVHALPAFTPAAHDELRLAPRIAIAEPAAAPPPLVDIDRASSRSARGPPRA